MNLPTGTVTFLFTDIEGSTRLAREHRDHWDALQERHHAILREAIGARGGYVFQIVGDAFCAAFSAVEEAVRAAIAAQTDLDAEKWTADAAVKVRMGIHTGKAKLLENGEYQGYLAMSRVQRLMSAAHGGQVLLSHAAQELVREDLPEGVFLRDLGEHQLKDVVQLETIYQLVIPELAADFPPIKTLERSEYQPAARLAVRLMGTFELLLDGQPVNLPVRAAQSLLAYLILNPGTPHRREKLAGMFWPEAAEEKARTNLRHELWRIRKALPTRNGEEYLIADDMTISFNRSADYWLDADALRKVKDSASIEELTGALFPFRGELLPGFYEEWIVLEREHLQALYEERVARLLEMLEAEKRWHEVLKWGEHWIAHGQGPEAAYRALMTAYDAMGDRARLAATYKRCVDALHELGLQPSEQTRALAFKRTSKLKLPVPLTSFIGRERELEEVAKLLSKSRLVTLTGSGGVGKTRLAIQVVADILENYPDGVWFLDLAPVSDPALVPNTLAGVLDLQLMGGSEMSFTDLIIGYLRSRRALVIFDNCEHLVESCAQLAYSLLTSCEHLSILATSREALRVSGEVPYRVPSLEIPALEIESVMDTLAKTESVRLFLERASVVSPGFALSLQNALVIAKICQRLDGVPLAIELAAARVTMLTVVQILKRLDDRFNLLTSGVRTVLPRHQTLRATIEWSYDLLSEKERLLFRRLAVFVGGWTLEAAESVCSGEGIELGEVLNLLSQLIDKSLVLADTVNEVIRYRRLETIRQFACEKLAASNEMENLRARHLEYFLKLGQQADLEWHGPLHIVWRERLEAEYENMRTALDYSFHNNSQASQELAIAFSWFWDHSGRWREMYEWLGKMLARPSEMIVRARLLVKAMHVTALLSYHDQSLIYTEECLTLSRQLGYKEGMATSLYWMGGHAYWRTDFDQAVKLLTQSCDLWRELAMNWRLRTPICVLGLIAVAQGNYQRAQQYFDESLLLSRVSEDQGGVGWTLYLMGELAISQENDTWALELYEESYQIIKALDQKPILCGILSAMGEVNVCRGEYEKGRQLFEQAMDLCQKMGDQAGIASSLTWLGWSALLQGEYETSRAFFIQSLQLVYDTNAVNRLEIMKCLLSVAQFLAVQGASEKFAYLVGVAESVAPNYQSMLAPRFRKEIDANVKRIHTELGDDAYIAALEAGHTVGLDEAIRYALSELKGT